MKVYRKNGLFGEGDVYVLETESDWIEYEAYLREINSGCTDVLDPNFAIFKRMLLKYVGKVWEDKGSIRYMLNGNPVYRKYRIIGMEEDDSNLERYWIMRNIDDDRDIIRILAGDVDIRKGLTES